MLNLTEDQSKQLEDGVPTMEILENFWRMWPELNFDAAVGGAIKVGQERNERFSDEEPKPSEDFVTATTSVEVD